MSTISVPLNHILAAVAFLKIQSSDVAELAERLLKNAAAQHVRREVLRDLSCMLGERGFVLNEDVLRSALMKTAASFGIPEPIWAVSPEILMLEEQEVRHFSELNSDRPTVRFGATADGYPAIVLQSRYATGGLAPSNRSRGKIVRLFRVRLPDFSTEPFGTATLRRLRARELAVIPEGNALMEAVCASMAGDLVGFETTLTPPRKGSKRDALTPNFKLRCPEGLPFRAIFRMPQIGGSSEPSVPVRMTVDHLLGRFHIFGTDPLPISAEIVSRVVARLWWFGGSAPEMLALRARCSCLPL